MGKAFLKKTTSLLQAKRKRKRWQRTMISLSLVVAMVTSCLLIHPAITMERTAICGQEEHTHTEECYEHRLVCGKIEQSAVPATEEKVLNCPKTVHEHGEGCYDAEGQLVCTAEAHNHDDSCYQIIRTEGVEGHTHTDACYEDALICGKQEHTHTEACYPKETEAATQAQTKTVTEAAKTETATEKAETEKATEAEKPEARTLTVKNGEYTIQVDCPADAKIPKNAVLSIREIKKNDRDYNSTYEKAASVVLMKTAKKIETVRFFDLSISADGKEIQPEAAINVKITFTKPIQSPEGSEVRAVRLGDDADVLATNTNKANGSWNQITFKAKKLTVYATAEIAVPVAETAVTETETSEVMMLEAEAEETETEAATEAVTEEVTEAATEEATEAVTEEVTEAATEEATEAVMEEVTEAVTEESTEEPDTEEMTEEDPATPHILTTEGSDYTVEVTYTAEAGIPEGAELQVREIAQGTAEYESYYQQAMAAVQEGDTTSISFARFFDISFVYEGEEIEPSAPVAVKITYADAVEVPEAGEVKSVHFGDEAEVLNVQTNEKNGAMDEVTFDAESFSVYGIVGRETITGDVLTADGETYTVSVTYGADAKIPDGATLNVEEIDPESDTYQKEVENAEALLNKKNEDLHVHQARFFDVKIMDGEKEIQPEADVKVEITAKDITDNGQGLYVTHTHGSKSELINAKTEEVAEDESKFSFTIDSFSNIGTIIANTTTNMVVGDTATLEGSSSYFNDWKVDTNGIVNISQNGNSATIVAVRAGTVKVTHTYYIYMGFKSRSETFTINVTESSTVTATFNKNNGSGTAPDSITVDNGEDITFPGSNGLTRNGYVFVGWSTDADATGSGVEHHRSAVYQENDTITLTANTTFYAVWAKTNQSATFYIRLDGAIPQEPPAEGESYPASEYTSGVTINNVLKEAKFYANTSGVDDNLNGSPTNAQLVAMINDKSDKLGFSVEVQNNKVIVKEITDSSANASNYNVNEEDELYVIWYVCKQAAAGPVLSGYNQTDWHVDGVLLTRQKLALIYSSGSAPAGTVSNMPTGYGKWDINASVTVGCNAGNNRDIKQPSRSDGYTFAGWKKYVDTNGDGEYAEEEYEGVVYTDDTFNIQYNTKLVAQWVKGTATLKIKKIDSENNSTVLSGAEFKLTTASDSNGRTVTADENGIADFGTIELDTVYELEETKAPTGYTKLINKIYFKFVKNESAYSVKYYTDINGSTETTVGDSLTATINSANLTLNIKNMREKGSVSFTKVGEDGITGLNGATFTLYKEESCTTEAGYTVTSATVDDVSGKVTFSDIPTGTYYMKETSAPTDYEVSSIIYEVVINATANSSTIKKYENGTAVESNLSTISNKLQRTDIVIKKVDNNGMAITNAEFTLEQKINSNWINVGTIVGVDGIDSTTNKITINNTDGKKITGLPNGIYKLTETKAPDGYIILTDAIYFKVSDHQVRLTNENGEDQEYSNAELDNLTINVKNTPGEALPNTGGSGTLPYTLGGLMLMSAAALMYGFIMRRRGRRLN